MADLATLQQQFNRHPLIVKARLDGYDIVVCPLDADIYITFPPEASRSPDLPEDDLFEHPDSRGQACADYGNDYVLLSTKFEDADFVARLIETLNDEQERRSAKTGGSA